jgi:NADP-dependent 3-hydroxy acid dehydrogenase YdfG
MGEAQQRRVVVTGASSGIGAATVRLFRAHGWDVLGVARRGDRLEALAAETGCDVMVVDVTDGDSVAAMVERLEQLGPVHALVNNAGGAFGQDSIESGDVDEWRRMYEVNVIGVKRVTTAVLPLLRRAVAPRDSASIVNITSIAAHIAYEGGGGYNAAKFAAHALTAVLRLELAGEPIRVVEIAPGMVKTDEFSLVRFAGDQAKADKVYENVPAPLTADDVAAEIVHACELAPHIDLDLVTIKPVAQAAPWKVMRGELTPRS